MDNNRTKEAERPLEQYDDACLGIIGMSEEQARTALLAHIQRELVPDGWKEATIAWEVCASIHREYAKKKDPFFTTRQADFVRHTEAARAALLAAAPAPYQFRDAAKIRFAHAEKCNECESVTARLDGSGDAKWCCICGAKLTGNYLPVPAPAEVPMPEPDVTALWDYTDSSGEGHSLAYTHDQMRTYGERCRAAGEAAGYARGLKEAGVDVDVFHDLTVALRALLDMPDNENTKRHARLLLQRAETALRGEAK